MASALFSRAALMNSSGGVRIPNSTTLKPASRRARDKIFVPITWASLPTVPVITVGLATIAILLPLRLTDFEIAVSGFRVKQLQFNSAIWQSGIWRTLLRLPDQLAFAECPEILNEDFVIHLPAFCFFSLRHFCAMEFLDLFGERQIAEFLPPDGALLSFMPITRSRTCLLGLKHESRNPSSTHFRHPTTMSPSPTSRILSMRARISSFGDARLLRRFPSSADRSSGRG